MMSRPGYDPSQLRASGGWLEGDPVGNRQFAELGWLRTESGEELPIRLAFETFGELNSQRSNAVLVLHALTGDSHVAGETGPGHPYGPWWPQLVGPGQAIDTDRYFVVAANILGGCQGSTGPSSPAPDGRPWGSRFPQLSPRDQVAAEMRLADHLGISRFHLVIGASMGGHRALEWALMSPDRVENLVVIASGARTTADQISWAYPQLAALELDPAFNDGDYYDAPPGQGPYRGLGIARAIAHATYRTADELNTRFGRVPQKTEEPLTGGRFAVQSYLEYHATKLAVRFDAGSYRTLTHAMIRHDVGRRRGGYVRALQQISARTLVVAVDSDRLFPPAESHLIASHVPDAQLMMLSSPCGHDGFLVESAELAAALREFLASAPQVEAAPLLEPVDFTSDVAAGPTATGGATLGRQGTGDAGAAQRVSAGAGSAQGSGAGAARKSGDGGEESSTARLTELFARRRTSNARGGWYSSRH